MDLIVALIAGGIIGWLASLIMHTNESLLMNIIVGIVGSFAGRFIFGSVLGIGSAYSAGSFSIAGFLWGVVGAVILLAIVGLFQRRSVQ